MRQLSTKSAIAIIVVLEISAFSNIDVAGKSPIAIVVLGDSTTAPRNVGAGHSGRPDGVTTRGENAADPNNAPHNIVLRENRTSPWLYVYSDVLRDELPARGILLCAVDNE